MWAGACFLTGFNKVLRATIVDCSYTHEFGIVLMQCGVTASA